MNISTLDHNQCLQRLEKRLALSTITLHALGTLIIARYYLKYDINIKEYSDIIFSALEIVKSNFQRCMIDPEKSMDRIYREYLSIPIKEGRGNEQN